MVPHSSAVNKKEIADDSYSPGATPGRQPRSRSCESISHDRVHSGGRRSRRAVFVVNFRSAAASHSQIRKPAGLLVRCSRVLPAATCRRVESFTRPLANLSTKTGDAGSAGAHRGLVPRPGINTFRKSKDCLLDFTILTHDRQINIQLSRKQKKGTKNGRCSRRTGQFRVDPCNQAWNRPLAEGKLLWSHRVGSSLAETIPAG